VQHSRAAEGWYHVEDPDEVSRCNDRFHRNNEKYGDKITPQRHWLYSYDAEKTVLGTGHEWRDLPPW